jgi:hypothetical protein
MSARSLIPLILAALLLVACGSDDDGESESAASSSPTVTAMQAGTATISGAATSMTTAPTTTAEAVPTATTEAEPTASAQPSATVAPEPTATPEPQPTAEPTATPEPAGPIVVRSGVLQTINYDGSGNVTVVQNPDGSHVIRFSDFQTEDGPGLVVYLSTASELSDGAILSADNLNLGDLQSTSGDQEYYLAPDIDPFAYASVVVWCVDFDTGFVGAVLE